MSQWPSAPHLDCCVLSCVPCRLIGTATVSLKDLTGDQSRSRPYKLISLLNERGQDTGVSILPLVEDVEVSRLSNNSFRKAFEVIISSLCKNQKSGFEINGSICK